MQSRVLAHSLAAALFVLLAGLSTWPLLGRGTTHIFGDLSDPLAWVWFLHWGYHGLVNQPFDLFQANQLYPTESSFAFISNHCINRTKFAHPKAEFTAII